MIKIVVGVLLVGLMMTTALVQTMVSGIQFVLLDAPPPTELAVDDIPEHLFVSFVDTGQICPGITWNVTAGISKVEHNHGRDGEFTFSPPVPPLEFRPDDGDPPIWLDSDDGVISPREQRLMIIDLVKFLCENADIDDHPNADGEPGAPLEVLLAAYNPDEEWIADVLEAAVAYGPVPGNCPEPEPEPDDDDTAGDATTTTSTTVAPTTSTTAADGSTTTTELVATEPCTSTWTGGACPPHPTPESENVTYKGITVHACIMGNGNGVQDEGEDADLMSLLDHAERDGIVLRGWGWRDHFRQHQLRRSNGCRDGSWVHRAVEPHPSWVSASRCRVPTARPGNSMHERGQAIDFTYRGSTIKSRRSPAFRWLAVNAARYGFINLPSEPWHWSTNGK